MVGMLTGTCAMRCVVALALVASAVDASAQPAKTELNPRFRKEAERRNQKGTEFYNQGRFEEALQLYQAAYDLYPAPRFLFNVGLAREKTFDYEGCAAAFQRFVADATDATADVRNQASERLRSCYERAEIPVRLTSAPSNAAIYVGDAAGRTLKGRTPVELKLAPGTHVVAAEMSGYTTSTQTVTVEPGQRPQIDFVLEKLSMLRVEVDPPSAKVQLDDLPPEPAPLAREVERGTHQVRVTREGYEPLERHVSVEAGREVSLVLSLRAIARPRSLEIRADAERPSVRVDGVPVGTAPMSYALRPGPHRVQVTAPGRLPYRGDLTIPDDRDILLDVRLEARRSRKNRVVFWTLLGAAATAAVIGAYHGLSALEQESSFESDPSVDASKRGESRAETADVWLAIGGVLGGGAFAWHLLTAPGQSTAEIE